MGEFPLAIQNDRGVPPLSDLSEHGANGGGLAAAAVSGDEKMLALVAARDDDFAEPKSGWWPIEQTLEDATVELTVEFFGSQQL